MQPEPGSPEAEAEVTLLEGASIAPSPLSSFGFITTFGDRSFSAAVIPDGTAHLVPQQPQRIRLQFLVTAAADVLVPDARFSFFEQGRVGEGRILTNAL